MSKGQLVITAVVVEGRLPTMGPATVQAVCGRGRGRVRTALTTPHTNARAVRPDVEDRILRLRKTSPSKASMPAPKPSPPTSPQTHHQLACGIHHRAHPDR